MSERGAKCSAAQRSWVQTTPDQQHSNAAQPQPSPGTADRKDTWVDGNEGGGTSGSRGRPGAQGCKEVERRPAT